MKSQLKRRESQNIGSPAKLRLVSSNDAIPPLLAWRKANKLHLEHRLIAAVIVITIINAIWLLTTGR